MSKACTWHFIISFIIVQTLSAQSKNDSLFNEKIKAPINLRFGIDLFQPITSQFDKNLKGFEIVGDLRVKENFYLSTEIGALERTQQSELINFTTSGSYIKLGFDFNMYKNWTGMNNQVYLGVRLANSIYNHNINNYILFRTEQFYEGESIDSGYSTGKISDLNAQWIEFLVGMKVQVLKNTYKTACISLAPTFYKNGVENY